MKTLVTLMLFAVLTASAASDPPSNPINDRGSRVRFLVGSWEGTASGQPGNGAVERTYEEGFVNTYALNSDKSMDAYLIFDSVNFENFSNEWKARESYEVISRDEFVEIFELVEPGKDFVEYSRNHFKRKK